MRSDLLGEDTKKVINFLFDQMMDTLMPPYMKYLIWCAINNIEIFAEDKE